MSWIWWVQAWQLIQSSCENNWVEFDKLNFDELNLIYKTELI